MKCQHETHLSWEFKEIDETNERVFLQWNEVKLLFSSYQTYSSLTSPSVCRSVGRSENGILFRSSRNEIRNNDLVTRKSNKNACQNNHNTIKYPTFNYYSVKDDCSWIMFFYLHCLKIPIGSTCKVQVKNTYTFGKGTSQKENPHWEWFRGKKRTGMNLSKFSRLNIFLGEKKQFTFWLTFPISVFLYMLVKQSNRSEE